MGDTSLGWSWLSLCTWITADKPLNSPHFKNVIERLKLIKFSMISKSPTNTEGHLAQKRTLASTQYQHSDT